MSVDFRGFCVAPVPCDVGHQVLDRPGQVLMVAVHPLGCFQVIGLDCGERVDVARHVLKFLIAIDTISSSSYHGGEDGKHKEGEDGTLVLELAAARG